ncbi:MAG: hypothetical protein WKF31_13145 [Thermoleophilaceae bacterium]
MTAAARELAHPPRKGRLLVPSGTGSYVLWRDPDRAVTIDGRLELYTARQVIANYRLLNGQGALRYLRRWRIGGWSLGIDAASGAAPARLPGGGSTGRGLVPGEAPAGAALSPSSRCRDARGALPSAVNAS